MPPVRTLPAVRIFLALLPPVEIAQQIVRRRRQLHPDLPGADAERLHVTLAMIACSAKPDDDLGKRVAPALPRLTLPQCDVRFDRIVVNEGFVTLRPSRALRDLAAMRRALCRALAAAGLPALTRSFNPHLTVSYDHRGLVTRRSEDTPPVAWRADAIMLIESRNREPHRHLLRVPLEPPRQYQLAL